ncbi:serine/threonine-protein phosphatase 6 regulatory ankyrin repeat subunit B isoform X2 [Lingula anatina]|uniref:Serine/threonine-protein phosphatase 6 regulatory ankyrin repeat subunit B isoform X2 n=1 Tax=Lingula anatina TaxID=7574 RepID=A0A1S3J5H3_LINAN|nr:serine/threonine-protein phosphatase 6 regulatory ankyrin repeat subunit B isoform X2 [Lingula anatina]|eukprot:XP_013405079.1 serine/threonine-protein phosphatase 6 regulatory ankyrin repeat subunit B isoform X2 [Lingula anatina]
MGNRKYNSTVLHEAVSSGNEELVKLILHAKAKVNAKNKEGRSALHIAARLGHSGVVQLLLNANADVNAQTKDGRTPLHVSLWRGHTQIAKALVKAGASVNRRDEDGWTPLHWAAKQNNKDALVLLLQEGAAVNSSDKNGHTAFHEAVFKGQFSLAKELVREGADVNLVAKEGPAFDILLKKGLLTSQSVSQLLDWGYDPRKNKLCTAKARFHKMIADKLQTVDTLTSLCRIEIRQILSRRKNCKCFSQRVVELPLPNILIDYIAMKSELES